MNAPQINVPDVSSEIRHQDVNLHYPEDVKAKILHILSIYPIISPSMMQISIGSNMPANVWKPILQDMIKNGLIAQDHIVSPTPGGRHQTYTLISLPGTSVAITSKAPE